jgi:radical SAM superfamily enzyme YgiQ (UPF0313 family)
MKFERREGLIVYHDHQPGNYVTMRGPRGGMQPRGGDHSDAQRRYAWFFEYVGELKEGDQFIFNAERATHREVVGEVRGGAIVVVSQAELLARPAAGLIVPKPLTWWEGAQRPQSGARVMAIFAGVQTPGAGWASLSHASANNESAYMAHGMSYISAYLKNRGHTVWLLDTRGFRSWEHFAQEIKNQQYDFAMLGPLSIEAFTGACIVRILKETHPNRPVIFGGLHISMTKEKVFPSDDLPKFYFYGEPPSRMREYLAMKGESAFDPARWPRADYVIWNEGELATAAVVEGDDLTTGDWDYEEMPGGTKFLNGKIVPDLNKMPHMDRSLFNEDMEKNHPLLPELPTPFHTITFGRGCPYHCSYSVTGDAVVLTEDGVCVIEHLVQGRTGMVHQCEHGGEYIEYELNKRVATPSGWGVATRLIDEGVRPVVRVTLDGAPSSIKATPNHKFLCASNEWKCAGDLRAGDLLASKKFEPWEYQEAPPRRVLAVEQVAPERVYDLTVPGDEAFIANGLIAHNCSVGEQFASTKVRLIDPDYFMDALHTMKRSNGGHIGSLMIHDDILLFPSWLEKWNEKIRQQFGYIPYWCQMRADFIVNHPDTVRHMAEAGMTWVSVGYEVGHARGLMGIMNKELKVAGINDPVEINLRAAEILRSLGVNSFGNFMFGNPTETNEEMDATVRMIQKIRPQHHGFSTYADFPGTPMSRLIDENGLRMNEWYSRSHYPWQYRLRGVDYGHVDRCIQIAAQTPREYMNPIKAGIAK